MIRYLTVAEARMLYGRPDGTIRRLASVNQWRRSNDRRKPVLYNATDVEKTMNRLLAQAQLDNPPAANDPDHMVGEVSPAKTNSPLSRAGIFRHSGVTQR